MLGLLEQLPRVQWVITTLGKKGSVLVERSSSKDAEGDAVLEDALNSMLTEAASSNSSSNGGSDGASQNGYEQDSQAACTSKTQAEIRWERLSHRTNTLLDMVTVAKGFAKISLHNIMALVDPCTRCSHGCICKGLCQGPSLKV